MKLSTLERKKFRVRNNLKKSSNGQRYRLSVSRSAKNISAQIIDDVKKFLMAHGFEVKIIHPLNDISKELSMLYAKKILLS